VKRLAAAAAAVLVAAGSLAVACAHDSTSGGGHRCGHVYVADPVVFYGGFYYGYDPYYDPYYGDPGYWSYDDSYDDDPSDDPGAGDPGYDDPGTGDESSLLHKTDVVTTKNVGSVDANGCYACVLECNVATSGGTSREIANGVSGTSDAYACGWAHKAIDAWASAKGGTVKACVRIDPSRTPAGASPRADDAGAEAEVGADGG
jgi:hypothetical protein